MPRCKFCKKEINRLINFVSGENKYDFWVDDEIPDYQHDEFIADNKTNDFECPECNEELFKWEGEAIYFLEDKDELQKIVKEKLNKIKKNDKKIPY